jgi:hypothetical protein
LNAAPLDSQVDRALEGAFDLHRHGYPEVTFAVKPRMEDVEDFVECREAGFRGVVLKSHMWPTMGRVYHLRKLVPGLEIIPSITLNSIAGGFSPIAVEAAALQGAGVVYMPTWTARNDIERGGASAHIVAKAIPSAADPSTYPSLSIFGPDPASETILPEVLETVAVAEQYGMVVFSGHLSPTETLALAEAGLGATGRFVFSHPDSGSIGATDDDIAAIMATGAVLELCALGIQPGFQRITPAEFKAQVDLYGAERCLITSDYFFGWAPPSAETIRTLAALLMEQGLTVEQISQLVAGTPARLLSKLNVPSGGIAAIDEEVTNP